MRGLAGFFERSWSGDPGTLPWTQALLPLAAGYAAASGVARARAARRRQPLPGCHVIAIGNLTVGGTGKSTIARWLALEAVAAGARAAVLLRGHGATAPASGRGVVPDFAGYPLADHVARYGDEAVALRLALPRGAAVAADPNRLRAAETVRSGYGARVLILDDGWEQASLAWSELWVALDPSRPAGNGSPLPAGPLRRPVSSLREAGRLVFLLEESGEGVPEPTLAWLARVAPGIPTLRLQRTLRGVVRPGGTGPPDPLPRGARVAVVSGIGAPARLDRFLRAAGAEILFHAAFPDHARWSASSLRPTLARTRRDRAEMILITEKDELKWPPGLEPDLPVRVIRTSLSPLDPVEEALRPMHEAMARPMSIV
jgi:tetraacyldisaccharide 4'-kinase